VSTVRCSDSIVSKGRPFDLASQAVQSSIELVGGNAGFRVGALANGGEILGVGAVIWMLAFLLPCLTWRRTPGDLRAARRETVQPEGAD